MAALGFGVIGAHPLVLALLLLVFRVVAVVCLRRALSCFIDGRLAIAVVLVWIVLPDHLALEMWSSSLGAPVALALLAEGVTQLARAYRSAAPTVQQLALGYLLLAGAVAFYELTAGVAVLAVIAVPLLTGRRLPIRHVIAGGMVVGLPLAWAALNVTVYDPAKSGHLDLGVAVRAQLSLGLAPVGVQGRIVGLVLLVAILVCLTRLASPTLRASAGVGERLVVAGTVILVLGLAPLINLKTNFQGLDDRLSSVSSIGIALIGTGAAYALATSLRGRATIVLGALALALLVLSVPVRAQRTHDLVLAGQRAVVAQHELAARVRAGERDIHLDAVPAVVDHYQGSNPSSSVQLELDDPTVDIVIAGVVDPYTAPGQR
jgi:hypothetical protein